LESLAQPANIIPYTPKPETANKYNTPKFKSAKQLPKLNGITAQANKLRLNVKNEDNVNSFILALRGITISFITNLKPSANG
jgi:hypothetical protein